MTLETWAERGPARRASPVGSRCSGGLVTDESSAVRQPPVRAVQRLAEDHPAEAFALIGQIKFSDSPEVADEVFAIFSGKGSVQWSALSPSVADGMLTQVVDCPSIDRHWVQQFLSVLSKDKPRKVAQLLRHRIERWEQLEYGGYDALPLHWNYFLQIRADPDLIKILRELVEWIAAAQDSWMRQEAMGSQGTYTNLSPLVLQDGSITSVDSLGQPWTGPSPNPYPPSFDIAIIANYDYGVSDARCVE